MNTKNHLLRFSLKQQFMIFFLSVSLISCAQLVGVKTIPGDYASLTLAVTDLNTQGVGAGGVTFNVAAGYTELLSGKITLTATGTLANPIVFQKSGVGANPLLTSYTGTVATPSVLADGFFVLAGSDYVTIDGIDLQENVANTTATTVMEFGYALLKQSGTDGCQNNTIQNCVITLNRLQNTGWTAPGHNGSCGIVVLNGLFTASGALTVTAPSGSNSFNKFYTNTIQNCNAGIVFVGFADVSPFTLGDTGNDIGGNSYATGNTILNFGGGAATNPATGIFVNQQWGLNASYNTLNNNDGAGVNHASTLRGIFLNSSSTSASVDCNFNRINLTSGATTSDLSMIENAFGSTPAGNTVNINNNILRGSYPTATSGAMRGIYHNGSTPSILNINNNIIVGFSYSNLANTGTGVLYPIHTSGSNATMTINANNNLIDSITRLGSTGGTTIGLFISAGVTGMQVNVKSNTIQNLSIDGTGTASVLYGIQTSTGTIVIDSNLVQNLSCLKSTGTGALYGIYDIASPVNENYNFNIVRNLTHNGTGIVYGLFANTTSGVRNVSNNLIHSLKTGGTTIIGLNMLSSSPTVFKNKIYDIESTSSGAPLVAGIQQGTLGTNGIANYYNNYVGDLRAPNASSATALAPSVRGLNISTTTTSSTLNFSFNTIQLAATSVGANFATAGLFVTTSTVATTSNLILKNNIIVNNSTPAGNGNAVAYQRSSVSLANFDATSNNNVFYAGSPSATNLLFFDGTNALSTASAYKGLVNPAETNSVAENAPFLSLVGSSPQFLHINPAIPTQIESGGTPIAGITDDYDGDSRNATTPDIGADEGTFIGVDLSGPSITYTPLSNSICTNAVTVSATIADQSGVSAATNLKPRLWFKKTSENNVLPATNTSADNGWKFVEASNSVSPFSFPIDYSLLNSPLVGNDIVEYFIVAQDSIGNIGTNNATYTLPPTSVALAASVFPVSGVRSFRVIQTPAVLVTNASTNLLCFIGSTTLTLSGDTVTGAEYQWQKNSVPLGTWSNIVGANSLTYVANNLDTNTAFQCVVSCGGSTIITSDPTLVIVNKPTILATQNDTVCGPGPVSAKLTASANAVVSWYDTITGGTALATGDTFITPLLTANKTYYAVASISGGSGSVGPLSPAIGTTSASNIAIGTQRMFFNVLANTTLLSVDIFPTATIGSAGSIVIRDNTQTVLATIPYTTTVTGGAKQTISMNVPLSVGTGYEIGQGTAINLNRNTTGAVYPYTSSEISITGNTFDPAYYYFYYNWQFSSGCSSLRTPVTAVLKSGVSSTTTIAACDSFTWSKNGVKYFSSGTYTFGSGCDIDSLVLTINHPVSGTDTKVACSSFTWIDGNTYTANNSTATYTYIGGASTGCDSSVTLNLTINNPTTSIDSQTVCGSYTWRNGVTYTASNSTAKDTIVGGAVNGCDSIISLNLTINNPTTGIDVQSACVSYTWRNGVVYTVSNNTAQDTIIGGAANGCDSIITLNLVIGQTSSGTDNKIACGSFSFNGQTLTQSGTYLDTIANIAGCDSFITLNLTINLPSASTIRDTICSGASYTFGSQTLTASGTYNRTLTNAAGCDSVITLNLFVRPALNPSIIQTGFNLSTQSFSSYEWILNGNNIGAANTQNYIATANGSYTVQVTDANGCRATSPAIQVTGVGINDVNLVSIYIYPSPAVEVLNVEVESNIASIRIFDLNGKLVLKFEDINTSKKTIDISSLSSATYHINVKTKEGKTTVRSFIKE